MKREQRNRKEALGTMHTLLECQCTLYLLQGRVSVSELTVPATSPCPIGRLRGVFSRGEWEAGGERRKEGMEEGREGRREGREGEREW